MNHEIAQSLDTDFKKFLDDLKVLVNHIQLLTETLDSEQKKEIEQLTASVVTFTSEYKKNKSKSTKKELVGSLEHLEAFLKSCSDEDEDEESVVVEQSPKKKKEKKVEQEEEELEEEEVEESPKKKKGNNDNNGESKSPKKKKEKKEEQEEEVEESPKKKKDKKKK